MENLRVPCHKCKKYFEVENKSGIYKCPHCDTEKEVYTYHEELDCEDINVIVELQKDLMKVFKKHGLDYGKVTTMDIAEKLYLKELCLVEDINL